MQDELKTVQGGTCGGKKNAAAEKEDTAAQRENAERLARIGKKIAVLSGKGGVGKSTVAVNLASALAGLGNRVGLLDADLHGPSVPTMLNLAGCIPKAEKGRLLPVEAAGMKVMSLGLLLQERDVAVIWRGPRKAGVLKQLIEEVDWGDLDFLVVDCPPGTGDEPLSVCQILAPLEGGVIVTTPQELALADVRRSVSFCREIGLPVLGVVENMSGYVCRNCGAMTEIFKEGGGERMAREMGVPFLGRIPIDPQIVTAGDAGLSFLQGFPSAPGAVALNVVISRLLGKSPAEKPDKFPSTEPLDVDGQTQSFFGRISDPTASASVTGPCGDTMEFYLVVSDGRIADVRYHTDGCAHTRIYGEMVAAMAKGLKIEEALRIHPAMILAGVQGLPEANRHCAVLAVSALYRAIGTYMILP